MKQRKRWLGLAAAPFALAMFAFAQLAHAADYTGDCASIPNHVTGNATVSDTTCVIDTGATLIVDGTLTIDADSVDVKSEIQSVGKVTVRTNGGGELKLRKKASSQNNDILLQSPQNRIDTKGLEAGNSVQVDAGLNGAEGSIWDIRVDGQIVVNKVQANQNPDLHANVLLRAAGPINTKTIKTDGDLGAASIKSGGIQIEAYRSGAAAANSAEFVIGGTAAPNGVNGNIVTQSTIGGGTSASFVNGGVYVTMGGRFNTGNIRVADMSAIKVRATQSRSGFIIFNANAGTIFLPTGNLNSSGDDTNNSGAGLIYLLAKTLDTQPGTIISANQSETAVGTGHQIFICVETLKYRGNGTDGLKILNDGNGGSGFFSLVNISPQGYLVPGNLTSNVNQMPWTFTLGSAELAKDGPLTIDGSEGNGQILLRADGNTAAVNVSGYPLAFNGGDVTVRSRGQTLHRINVGFFGTVNGARQGLIVNNVGNWVLDANGKAPASGGAAAGGIIQVKADQTSLIALNSANDPSSGNIVIRANGDDTNGDGGIVLVDTKSFELGESTHAVVNASGAPNGTGNAVNNPLDSAGPFAVTLKTGSSDLFLGGGNRAVKISANGGKTSGNGGTVRVLPSNTDVRIRNSTAIDVSAIANGSGGNIQITSVKDFIVNGGTLLADAGSDSLNSGNGGNIDVNSASLITQNPSNQNITIVSAKGQGNGTGGAIKFTTSGSMDFQNGALSVDGGCDGGDGGTIDLTANDASIAEGNANAGGSCIVSSLARNGLGPTGNSNGGKINITTVAQWNAIRTRGLHQDGAGTGRGGTININTGQPVDLSTMSSTATITAKGGSSPNSLGGSVTIKNVLGWPSNRLLDEIVIVSGGKSLAETQDNGKIKIDTVSCQQRNVPAFTGTENVTYWNCYDSTMLGNVLTGLSSASRSTYQAAKVKLFAFADANDATKFLGANQIASSSSNLGFTRRQPSNYIVAYFNGPNGQNTAMSATIRHEIGHQIDYNTAGVVLSQSAYMQELMQQDWASFDGYSRCFLFPAICNTAPYNQKTNRQILGGSGLGGIPFYFNPTVAAPQPGVEWNEVFAEHFAVSSGGGYNSTIDGWLAYFPCTSAYVNAVYQGTIPIYPSSCSPPVNPRP